MSKGVRKWVSERRFRRDVNEGAWVGTMKPGTMEHSVTRTVVGSTMDGLTNATSLWNVVQEYETDGPGP